jgi:hypothetical protein
MASHRAKSYLGEINGLNHLEGVNMKTYADLMRLGVACDEARLAKNQAEIALQDNPTAKTDAAYYDAVAKLVELEQAWEKLSAELG